MNEITQKIQNFSIDMDSFLDMDDKFLFFIEKGKVLSSQEGWDAPKEAYVRNCTSNSWFISTVSDHILTIHGNSQSMIICGIIAVIKQFFDGMDVSQITKPDVDSIFKTLQDNLSQVRQETVFTIMQRLKDCL